MSKKGMSRRGFLATALLSGTAGGATLFGPWKHTRVYAANSDKPIKIGLTHDASGQFANSGQAEKRGTIMAIEPDLGTDAINFPDRQLARRILDHECDVNVPQGLLVRDLSVLMQDIGLRNIRIDTRIVIIPPELGASYFTQSGVTAEKAGVISTAELEAWTNGIENLRHRGRLFCSVGYYLFSAEVCRRGGSEPLR